MLLRRDFQLVFDGARAARRLGEAAAGIENHDLPSKVAEAVRPGRIGAPDQQGRAKALLKKSEAVEAIFENPLDDLYRVDVTRVVTWMYGTVGGWTEWRF